MTLSESRPPKAVFAVVTNTAGVPGAVSPRPGQSPDCRYTVEASLAMQLTSTRVTVRPGFLADSTESFTWHIVSRAFSSNVAAIDVMW